MKYSIGIDLGTTNSELAYCLLNSENGVAPQPEILEIPQFVEPSVLESRSTLPSALYIGPEEERDLSNWALPWDSVDSMTTDAERSEQNESGRSYTSGKPASLAKGFFKKIFGLDSAADSVPEGVSNPNAFYLVGEVASRRAASYPERVVSSAKSWLTCAKLDRRQPILPWNAPDAVSKVSPVEASRRYLAHLAAAWNHAFPDDLIFDQQVVLTLPASFDESARELTREAAGKAGLNLETLLFLEEPQAALYSWLARKGDGWRKELSVGDVALVCDVGGGTTDLSLIRVEEEDGDLLLRRLAVGNRLLLGGDNIDLAFAHRAAELFNAEGVKLNPWQSGALWRQCRDAKEALLDVANDESGDSGASDSETYKISILGRSSRLVGDSVSVLFPKNEAVAIALDGFFPFCSLNDRPKRRSGFGLREAGLPYEADAAITKHVAAFLSSRVDESGAPIVPTRFLLNGGVFRSPLIASRFQQQLEQWYPDACPANLFPETNLESAVACGASYYGFAKHGAGIRIRGASPRSYYIGIEASGPAIPGISRPLKALCVAPVGMEEGSECDVPSDAFELVVGEPVTFRFFSSTTRRQDVPGAFVDWVEDQVADSDDELQETDPIETRFDTAPDDETTTATNEFDEPEYVAVRFHTRITEMGAMEIWCDEVDGSRSWKLEFSVREE